MALEEEENEWYEFLYINISIISAHPDVSFLDSVAFALGPVVYCWYKHWKTTIVGNSSSCDEKVRYVLEFWRSTQLTQTVDGLSKIYIELLQDLSTSSHLREKIQQHFIFPLLPAKEVQNIESYITYKIQCPLCNKKFQYQDMLEIHAKRIHKVAKATLHHVQNAMSYNTSYDKALIDDILCKINTKNWTEPLGKAVEQTLKILKLYQNWDTWNLMLSGTIAVASSLLNLQPTTDELSKYANQITLHPDFYISGQLGEHIMHLFSHIKYFPSYSSELLDNVDDVRKRSQSSFKAFSSCIKDKITMVPCIHHLTPSKLHYTKSNDTDEDIKLRKINNVNEGITIVDLIFDSLLERSDNLEKICNGIDFKTLWFKLNVNPVTRAGFDASDIFSWLDISKMDFPLRSQDLIAQKFLYILLVRTKLLLVNIIHKVFRPGNSCTEMNKDIERNLSNYTLTHFELHRLYETVLGTVYVTKENLDDQIASLYQTCRNILKEKSRIPIRKASY